MNSDQLPGSLLLAFPAIFPASVTLVEKHETEHKRSHGLYGVKRGRRCAALDCDGCCSGEHRAGCLCGSWMAGSPQLRSRNRIVWRNRRLVVCFPDCLADPPGPFSCATLQIAAPELASWSRFGRESDPRPRFHYGKQAAYSFRVSLIEVFRCIFLVVQTTTARLKRLLL